MGPESGGIFAAGDAVGVFQHLVIGIVDGNNRHGFALEGEFGIGVVKRNGGGEHDGVLDFDVFALKFGDGFGDDAAAKRMSDERQPLAVLRLHGVDRRHERGDVGVRVGDAFRPVAVAVPVDDMRGGARKRLFEEVFMFGGELGFAAFPAWNIPDDVRSRPPRETGVELRGLELVADGLEHALRVGFVRGVADAVAVVHDAAIA